MKIYTSFFLILGICLTIISHGSAQYDFKTLNQIDDTPIKSQDKTGTCWSFSAASFIESEMLRKNDKELDLSEMYIVRQVYIDKASNYLLRQGKANFSEGALAHDLFNAVAKVGIVPEKDYSGKIEESHDHSVMFEELKSYLDTLLVHKEEIGDWKKDYNKIMDQYLGSNDIVMLEDEKEVTAKDYFASLEIDVKDFINLTSFTHHPFYENFILEIPDNFSNGSYYNVPIDELEEITQKALNSDHTVLWDGDVSEKGFSATRGLAIYPIEMDEKCFDQPCEELYIDQKTRQIDFENFSTTDDHLMHIVGMSEDMEGNAYYIIKNSWGEISDYKGYIMMSEAYFRAKTVAVTLDKNFIENFDNE